MKSRTLRILVVLMAMLMVGGMMASCNKETIKPEKVEKTMIGQWDYCEDNIYSEPQNFQDGVVDLTLNEGRSTYHGNLNVDFEYRIEDGMFYTHYYNNVTNELQSNGENAGKTIHMTHKDTLVIDTKIYCRL